MNIQKIVNDKIPIVFDFPETSFKVAKMQRLYNQCIAEHDRIEREIEKENNDKKQEGNTIRKRKTKSDVELSEEESRIIYKPLIDYIQMYYYETYEGNFFFYDNTKKSFELKKQDAFLKEVINKMDKSLFGLYFEKNDRIFQPCSRLDKPRVFEENGEFFINECVGFLHKKYLPFKDYSDETKANVHVFLDMIKLIQCNDRDDIYEAYTKYLSQLCRGMKTEVIIYKKSAEGCGKSTETDFIREYVLGKHLCCQTSSEPLTSNNNIILLGKLYVIFEELPVFSMRDWQVVGSKLKTWCTEKTCLYRGLYKNSFEANNISNFVINTNVDSINSSGRRVLIMPINNVHQKDNKYFKNIKDLCYNNLVGEAFYSYMMEVDISNFYAQSDFPESENKSISTSTYLPSLQKFLKFEYVLKKKSIINEKPIHLYEKFSHYCTNNVIKPCNKTEFMRKLETDLKIIPKKTQTIHYNVSYDFLKAIADKELWICQYDLDMIDDTKHIPNDPDFIDEEQTLEESQLEVKELKRMLKGYKNL
jgi:hypothetical protein